MIKSLLLSLISFYQRFLTVLSFGSCRYYPTCSEYAKRQFQHNSIFKALFFSTVRILKCNQLFSGGIDYPKVSPKLNFSKKVNQIDFWLVPTEKEGVFYLIKNFSQNKINLKG